MEPKDRLIVALDGADSAQAIAWARLMEQEVGLFKVGLELYLASGTAILKELYEQVPLSPGRLFLDLKFYDIPATVLGALRTIAVPPAFLTIPCDVGFSGLRAMVAQVGRDAAILAVTVLTSAAADDLIRLGFEPGLAAEPSRLVVRKALLAQEAGCRGVICSGRDVRAVKAACGAEFLAVCPGIRPVWSQVAGDDQQRIVTPLEAIRDGADYIVVGRPIRRAPDPVAAARRVAAEIAQGLAVRVG